MTTPTPPPSHRVSPGSVVLLAIGFGVLTGIGELALLAYDKFVGGDLVFVPRQVVWMAPLANVAYLLAGGLVLLVFTGGRPPLRAAVFLFAAIAAAAWLFMFEQLLAIANVVLAAGGGVVVMRLVSKCESGFERMARRTGVALGALRFELRSTLHVRGRHLTSRCS